MKYIVILGDGMADYKIGELGGKTPLEYANMPNTSKLAPISDIGLVKTVPDGLAPGSDIANLSVLGYNPVFYYTGRSPIEAVAMGVDLSDTDVALRCNLVTLAESGGGMVMQDYSAGEITTGEAKELIHHLKKYFDDDRFELFAGVSYRHCLVVQNGQIGHDLTPPHDITGRQIEGYLPKGAFAKQYCAMIKESYSILKDHPVNLRRIENGKKPANSIWLWGEGTKPLLPKFKDKYQLDGAVISAVDLLKGIALLSGMKALNVPTATGTYMTDFDAKADAAVAALKGGCDFVFVHIEAADECGHQGDLKNKLYSIEKIDYVLGKVLDKLEGEFDYRVMLLPDHATPLELKTHTLDPVPFLIYDSKKAGSFGAGKYCEAEAAKTGLFIGKGHELMDRFLK